MRNYPVIEIKFNRSKSPKMKLVDELACKLGAVQDGSSYYLEFRDIKYIFRYWERVNSLLNIIDKWKSFEIYYYGFLCIENKDYRRLFYSIQDMRNCYFWCMDKSGLPHCEMFIYGCRFIGELNPILSYGKWLEPSIKLEVAQKKLDACPLFDINRVIKMIRTQRPRRVIKNN